MLAVLEERVYVDLGLGGVAVVDLDLLEKFEFADEEVAGQVLWDGLLGALGAAVDQGG